MNFLSDNAFGAAPEMLEAIAAANNGSAAPYGDDEWTKRLEVKLADAFAHSVRVFPMLTGTAANALALSALVPAHGAMLCHARAHMAVDECGAPEFFARGGRVVTLEGDGGKLAPEAIERALAQIEKGSVHHSQPAAISVTQASEFGTCYRPEEIHAISEVARRRGMKLHMDGARLANAIVFLDCAPADVTWRAGVDVLSFGATKNGALAAEAVVFFNEEDARDFGYRTKQAGQLVSKMRFVSAQLICALEENCWFAWASRANLLAQELGERLAGLPGVEIANPIEANLVFAYMSDAMIDKLRVAGALFHVWPDADSARRLIRFVTSFATPDDAIEQLIAAANE